MHMVKVIVHIDLNAFFVRAEEIKNLVYRGFFYDFGILFHKALKFV